MTAAIKRTSLRRRRLAHIVSQALTGYCLAVIIYGIQVENGGPPAGPDPLLSGYVVMSLTGLAMSALLKGGLGLRLVNLRITGPGGGEVTRLLALRRTLFAWSPVLVCGLLDRVPSLVAPGSLARVAILLLAIGAGFAVARPERSLQDRLAGTRLEVAS